MSESSSDESHGSPAGLECMCCFGDIDASCYVEYKAVAEGKWLRSKFCEICVTYLLKSQFQKYKDTLAKSKCQAEMRRMVTAGPPVNVKDAVALPCGEDEGVIGDSHNGEVHSLWYSSDGEVHSAKLEGSLEGDARERYWQEIREFYVVDSKDDDDDGNYTRSQKKSEGEEGGDNP